MSRILSAVMLGVLGLIGSTQAGEPEKLSVLYLGNKETPRARAYHEFLQEHFDARIAVRDEFDPTRAPDVDVVLLDWSQSDVDIMNMAAIESPLGARESWKIPTVLLGSAGLLIAGQWETTGASG